MTTREEQQSTHVEAVLQDALGDPLKSLELDFKRLCSELRDKPDELEAILRNYSEQVSPIAIILVQAADTKDWALFEGQVNVRRGTFRILNPIQTFRCSRTDLRRPPNQAVSLAINCATVRGLPIWIP